MTAAAPVFSIAIQTFSEKLVGREKRGEFVCVRERERGGDGKKRKKG